MNTSVKQLYTKNRHEVRNGLIHGISVAQTAEFIKWTGYLNDLAIPPGIAVFLAAFCLVPLIQVYLHKMDKLLKNGDNESNDDTSI